MGSDVRNTYTYTYYSKLKKNNVYLVEPEVFRGLAGVAHVALHPQRGRQPLHLLEEGKTVVGGVWGCIHTCVLDAVCVWLGRWVCDRE